MIEMLFANREQRLQRKFDKAARVAPAGPLREFYQAGLPSFSSSAAECEMVAIDLETDGLDFASSSILEAGVVTMSGSGVDLGTAARIRFRPDKALAGSSVVVHRITDDALAEACSEEEGLARLFPLLAGKPLVAHFADIEAGFLDAACRRVYRAPFVAPFICTMQLEGRWFARARAGDGLRLAKLRAAYRLPAYRAHDGLTDALACAELLLAQMAYRDTDLTIGDLVRR